MTLLEKLKSLLGLNGAGGAERRGAEPDVTVEREPEAASERAVKGVDDAPRAPRSASADTEAVPVEEIEGIGPTYGERLRAAGIETVADLADSDAATVAEAAEAATSRAEDWLERARDRQG